MEAGGVAFREVQFEGPDSTNIVLLELLDKQLAQPAYSLAGYAAVGPVVTVVADASAEEAFYVNLLGLDRVASGLLTGSDIEQAVGLPKGAGLDYRVLGRAEDQSTTSRQRL
uniref:Uncharacterized protein n=2 Tax=Emiliania huxleyi TaxID=2903 RepID=A0A7S3RST0_EMIHU